jgi:type II secretory pathway component PulJ
MTDPTKNYSPFPALAVVLTAFILVYAGDLYSGLHQRAQLRSQEAALAQLLPEAQRLNATMLNLSRDLLQMAPSSPGAQKLVKDFKIQAVGKSVPTPAKP